MSKARILSAVLAAALPASVLATTVVTDEKPSFIAPLKWEKLAGPDVRAFDRIELTRKAADAYAVALLPADASLALPAVDLRLLVPRIPAAARGNADLTKIALIQREFNRNEVHNDLPGGLDFSIANNCLRQGLWEVKLAAKRDGKTVPLYHGWFDFPAPEYARLFEEVNGVPYGPSQPLLAQYPQLAGLPVPLEKLRKVESETTLPALDLHPRDAVQRLPEQTGKMKLLLTPAIATYGDFAAAANQPVTTAKFSEPGYYNPADPMKFDLSWLAHPVSGMARRVSSLSGGDPFVEIEIAFANGNRILFADRRIASLPARNDPPSAESDVLKIVSGIGTPAIHATASERAAELVEDRPRYLFLLDAKGALLDNHFGGMDGIYLWRDAGSPGSLHIWLCGYERIAFAAHFSTPWKF